MSRVRDCSAIENDLALFVGGDLDRRGTLEIGEHLAGCRQCTDAVGRLAASRAALREGLELGSGALPDLWPGVRARLAESGLLQPAPVVPGASAPVAALPAVRRWIPLSAAAAVLIALGLWMFTSPGDSGPASGKGSNSVARGQTPIPVQPVGLRRLEPGESALSNSATSIDALQEELRLRSSLGQPGGAEAASQHHGLH
jgi:anti-sigma factor RsiW